jgi:hypothetical protein
MTGVRYMLDDLDVLTMLRWGARLRVCGMRRFPCVLEGSAGRPILLDLPSLPGVLRGRRILRALEIIAGSGMISMIVMVVARGLAQMMTLSLYVSRVISIRVRFPSSAIYQQMMSHPFAPHRNAQAPNSSSDSLYFRG